MDDQVYPALGRIAEIGTLYDAKTDRFLEASILSSDTSAGYVSTHPDSLTEITISNCDSYGHVFRELHIDESTAVNALCGLVDLQGAATFLRDFPSDGGKIRAAVIHQVSTVQQALNDIVEAFKSGGNLAPLRTNDCTHVVTGIRWGLNSIVAANYATSCASDLSTDDGAAFQRDLDTLACAIESAFLPQQIPPEMELCNELTLYSDVFEKEGLVMQDVSEVCSFIRIVPDHIRRQSGGKGWPVTYTMVPITTLSYFLSLPQGFQYNLKPIRTDYFTNFIQLFDDFEASAVKLHTYYTYLTSHIAHTAKDHVNEVLDSIKSLEDMKSWTVDHLFNVLPDVRKGKSEPSILHDVYRRATWEEPTLKQLSAIVGQETNKLEFIANVTTQGAKYLGYNGLSLEAVKKSHKDTFYYIFHFNSASMDHKKEWNDNCALLLELLDQQGDHVPVYIMDHDATDPHANLEVPYICQYDGEKQCIADVLANRQFISSKCLARSCNLMLDVSEHKRPVKRRYVRIPCPSPGCESNRVVWVCPKCATEIEYGFSDDFFYCDCGRDLFSNYEFKCNGPEHGSSFETYDAEELRKLLGELSQDDYTNILILGETGVGKSTFINAFINYLSYSTLDEAKNADGLVSVIPCSFSLQTMNQEGIQENNIKVGARDDEADGSTGKSATQKSAAYPVIVGARTYRLIDTPGIGDTRGISYDKENMADILKAISTYDNLHGILVLVKTNNARLTITFRFCVKELLTHLHRSAAKNMAFGFTNARISNYAPGDTFKPLKSLLDEHSDIPITLSISTTYCFDSESFRYLAAYKQGIVMTNEEEFRRSWDHSSKEAHRLVNYFSSATPHPVTSTLSLNGAQDVVADPGLIKWQEHLHVLYELSEVKVEVTDTEIERQLKAKVDDVTLRQTIIARLDQDIEEYNQELDEIRRAAARFCIFLRQNSITIINDATLDYLDMLILDEKAAIETCRQRSIPIDANMKRLQALKDDRQIHIELVETFEQNMIDPTCTDDMSLDEQGVDALVKRLYELKHFGASLKHIKYVIDSSLEETNRERPFRVKVSYRSKYNATSSRRRESDDRWVGSRRSHSPSPYSSMNKDHKVRAEGGYEYPEIVAQHIYPGRTYAGVAKLGYRYESRSIFGRVKTWFWG
ncbi:aaa atpase domain containing [Trichoderma arundinaceum]|uniref:Aaa atpase domain containing n=1 Tax=Trichoderma arundinaceum TaxID=490622 RepID=A0A395NDE5_TRIAR|nr:aaa atpase domain containing [Trichoderma arundinaceum]